MLFRLDNVSVELKEKKIFDNLDLVFNKGDKIGIVGDNGEGKSTLLKIILSKIEYSGNVEIEDNNYGYLSQDDTFEDLKLIENERKELEEKLSSQEIVEDSELYEKILNEYNDLFSNDDYNRELKLMKIFQLKEEIFLKEQKTKLSGGESTKLKLIKLFAKRFNYYLFDEPTNHLDIYTKNKLIDYLKIIDSFIVVTHDIDLLNECVNKIWFVNSGKVSIYYGNYNDFIEKQKKEKEELIYQKNILDRKKKVLNNQIDNIKHKTHEKLSKKKGPVLNNLGTGRGSSEAAISKAQNLIKRKELEKNNISDIETYKDEKIKIKNFIIKKSYTNILNVDNFNKNLGDFNLNIQNFNISRGDKIALLGNNGSGKTTFLKAIYNKEMELGENVEVGYLSQKNEDLDLNMNVLEFMTKLNSNLDETDIRNALASFLFKKNDVYKKIKYLSGGEKIRLSLLKLILQGCNFLLLDEPSNHLDIKSKKILSQALKDYQGTILVVSHDENFLNDFVSKKVKIENGFIKQ